MVSSFGDLLLVEPEKILAEITAFRLELLGYKLRAVRTGSEANAAIASKRPAIAVVNTKLPDGDGLEWIARVRHEWSRHEFPILVMTLDPSVETVERAFHAGANDYLISPFDPTVLESKIQQLLKVCELATR